MFNFYNVSICFENGEDVSIKTVVYVADSVEDIKKHVSALPHLYNFVVYPATESNYTTALRCGEPVEILTTDPEFKKRNAIPFELKQMLDGLIGLAQCGGIRSYYDTEAPDHYKYADSSVIFNYLSELEEVAYCLENGDIEGAENYINTFVRRKAD